MRKTTFPDLVNLPDMYLHLWGKNVLRKIDRVLKKNNIDYIHSVSCPMGANMVALEIKKRTGLPWIAQFYDPFVENPTVNFSFNYFRRKFEIMEYEIAKNADFIIHTNDVIVDLWKERYGSIVEGKIKALPLSFNTRDLPKRIEKEKRNKIVISHIGEIYGSRSLKDIVDAISEIYSNDKSIVNRIEFKLVGRVNQKEIDYIYSKHLEDFFVFVGNLPPDQLISYYQDSDIFLVLDMNMVRSPFYPSKLMMYHYFQKPIIGITTPTSVMEDDLRKSGHHFFYYGDVKKIKRHIESILYDNQSFCNFDNAYWEQFTLENAYKNYMRVVDNILSKNKR